MLTGILIYPFISKIAHLFEKYMNKDVTDYKLISLTEPNNYRTAIIQDLTTLIKKIFKFNLHHLDIDQKILLNPEYTIAEKYYATYHLNDDQLDEDYDVLKTIEEALLRELLKRIHHGDEAKDTLYL